MELKSQAEAIRVCLGVDSRVASSDTMVSPTEAGSPLRVIEQESPMRVEHGEEMLRHRRLAWGGGHVVQVRFHRSDQLHNRLPVARWGGAARPGVLL